jgi:rod shape-determining protein MreC
VGIFRRHRFPLLVAFFLLVALILFSVHAGREPASTPFGRFMLEVVGPVQRLVTSTVDGIDSVWRHYFALVHAAKENEELRREVARMQRELNAQEELRLGNERLRGLLKLKAALSYPLVAGEVVAVDPTDHFRTAVINVGANSGVQKLMPVVQVQGAVGRVTWTSPNYAKVLLLTDPNSAVDVIVQRSRVRGIVEGAGKYSLRLKYTLHNDDVIPGDKLVASGAAGVFPKGIMIGTVTSVKKEPKGVFLVVDVEPAADFSRLEEVLVILHRRDFME